MTMLRYIKEGRIKVDKSKNSEPVTYHDSCNLARSCGIYEEPRELLKLVVEDFREMYPNRTENFCCTGGGGAMSMSEYTPRRLESAAIKAKQIADTGAKVVVTSCHNCVDGLERRHQALRARTARSSSSSIWWPTRWSSMTGAGSRPEEAAERIVAR